jgi:hypothetical protein
METPRIEPSRVEAPRADATADAEMPRRRSTTREPASFSSDRAASPSSVPTAVPVVSSTAAEETAQPKRGWWGKRLLGGKD